MACTSDRKDLNIQKLLKSKLKGHSKSYSDLGLGQLKVLIKYKALRQYKQVIEVSESKMKSTQLCSHCKKYTGPKGLEELEISQWVCSACKTVHSRNGNSAKNHLQAGRDIDRLFQASSLRCADCKGIQWYLFYLSKTDTVADHLTWL